MKDHQPYSISSFNHYIEDLFQLVQNPNNNMVIIQYNEKTNIIQQVKLQFNGLKVQKYPMLSNNIILTPQLCTQNDQTYQISFIYDSVDVIHAFQDLKTNNITQKQIIRLKESDNNVLFNIPVLVGSKYCTSSHFKDIISPDNPCGQFIIHGKQKVIVPFERMCNNEVVVYNARDTGFLTASISSKSFIDQYTNMNSIQVYLKNGSTSVKSQIENFFDICVQTLQFVQHGLKSQKHISVFILFYAFGYTEDKQIVELCSFQNDLVERTVMDALQNFKTQKGKIIQTSAQAIQFLNKQKLEKLDKKDIKQILQENILQHTHTSSDPGSSFKYKAEFLGFMIYQLVLTHFEIIPKQCRDSYLFKRVVQVGQLLFQFTEEVYKQGIKKIRQDLQNIEISEQSILNKKQLIEDFLQSDNISIKVQKAIQTGKWSMKLEGVGQTYKGGSLFSVLLQNKKISNNPAFGQQRLMQVQQRHIDSCTVGYIASEESTEGDNCGTVFTFALTCEVTQDYNSIIPSLFKIFEENSQLYNLQHYQIKNSHLTKLIIQGLLRYTIQDPCKFIIFFKKLRDELRIPREISYYIDEKLRTISINTDQGRYIRPVIQVDDDNNPKITEQDIKDIQQSLEQSHPYRNFEEFITKNPGKIHMLELKESTCSLIAENMDYLHKAKQQQQRQQRNNKNIFDQCYSKYDYIDMHPTQLNGAVSGSIIFSTHNPATRNTFSVAQKKRAVQEQIPDTQFVFNKKVYYLLSSERQIIRTITSDYTRLTKYASGHVLRVMVCTHDGGNQEDSIIMRQQTAQTLYLQSFEDIYETDISRKGHYNNQKFMKIPEKQQNKRYNYNKIDINGKIAPGTIVHRGDVIIGKAEIFTKQQGDIQQKYNDMSIIFQNQEGIVIQSIENVSNEGISKITLKIKQFIFPEVGDKFAVGCGQKATIGKIIQDYRTPYFEDGTQPDVIFNIHSIASRRTLGLLFEGIISQYAIHKVKIVDGTPFQSGIEMIEKTKKMLVKKGFNDCMLMERIDPFTMQSTGKVFRATLYYHALEQKSRDKIYSVDIQCSTKSLFTRHNISGRQKKGALKFGDMERSCALAQGAVFWTQEIMMHHCDGCTFNICTTCFNFCERDIYEKKWFCQNCRGKSKVQPVVMSYALMQLHRILKSMGIDLNFIPQTSVKQILEGNVQI